MEASLPPIQFSSNIREVVARELGFASGHVSCDVYLGSDGTTGQEKQSMATHCLFSRVAKFFQGLHVIRRCHLDLYSRLRNSAAGAVNLFNLLPQPQEIVICV